MNVSASESPLDRIDSICDRFEHAYLAGQNPKIEAYLADADESLRDALFEELLKLEIEHRRQKGESPQAEHYLTRFPERKTTVHDLFGGNPKGATAASFDGLSATVTHDSQEWANPGNEGSHPLNASEEETTIEPFPECGRYRILRRLGSGSFGVVYLAEDTELPRRVAVKMLRPEWQLSPAVVDQFRDEARRLALLDHPHIVPVYDVGQAANGSWFVVSKYISGGNLKDRIQEGELSVSLAVKIIASLAEALHHTHQKGLVHRDVKPANVMMTIDDQPLLTDFGLALHETEQRQRRDEVSGSPAYMAPEQTLGKSHQLDGRIDVWALGVMLYEMLTGRQPFAGETQSGLFEEIREREPKPPRMINDTIPTELERIAFKCLKKDVSQRYATAKDLATDLRGWSDGTRLCSHNNRVTILAGGVAIAAILLIGMLWNGLYIANNVRRKADNNNSSSAILLQNASQLRVVSIEIQHYARLNDHDGKPMGILGKQSFKPRLGDQVTVKSLLSHPAYAYLLAFRPDGQVELCFPEDDSQAPPITDRPSYPSSFSPPDVRYGLSEGTGLWVFAVVASDKPLPAYRDFITNVKPAWPQEPVDTGTIWWHNGQRVEPLAASEPDRTRSKGEKALGTAAHIVNLIDQLQAAYHAPAVAAIGFGVEAVP